MVISNEARKEIALMIKNVITSAEFGNDGTDPTVSDTVLGNSLITKTPTVSVSNNRITSQTSITSTELIGETLKEEGIFMGSILLDRVVYPDFNKNDTNEFYVTNIIRVI